MARGRLRSSAWRAVAVLPLRARRHVWYLWSHRTAGNFATPTRFSEKVNWRILNDRSPELAWTCDKLAMKDHVRRLAPGVSIPETLWVGTDLNDFARADLPERWVLKANHRSQNVFLGEGSPDVRLLGERTAGWLGEWQGKLLGEWAYREARRTMFAEAWIGDSADAPIDYKFFVFHGEPLFVQVDVGRFRGHLRRFYTADWEPLEVRNFYGMAPVQQRPAHLDQMLEHASAIGRPFDFMRVDLFDTSGGVYFGETTPYPGGGLERFHPADFDDEMGSLWTLRSPRPTHPTPSTRRRSPSAGDATPHAPDSA